MGQGQMNKVPIYFLFTISWLTIRNCSDLRDLTESFLAGCREVLFPYGRVDLVTSKLCTINKVFKVTPMEFFEAKFCLWKEDGALCGPLPKYT